MTKVFGLSPEELQKFKDIEKMLIETDALVEHRAKSKNDLESFVYAIKSHITEPKFEDCFDEKSKEELSSQLQTFAFWLEDNAGINLSVEEYQTKLTEAKDVCNNLAPKLFQKLDEIEKEKEKAAAEAASAPVVNKKSKPRTNQQKLEAAANKKEHGNKLFVDLDYVNAIRRYTQALELLQSMFDVSPEQKEEANKLKVQCYLNLAGCLLKVEAYQKAIENCKSALELDPENAKALFRRGQGYYELKEYDLAKVDLTQADKAMPNNKQIVQLLNATKKEVTKREEKEKKMYAKMFT